VLSACTILAAGAVAPFAPSAFAAEAVRLEDFKPIPLKPGANVIRDFTPDGRDAIVAQGWRDNGNAHGYTVLLVLVSAGNGRFNVVPVERPGTDRGAADTIADDPHLGEDAVRSVRLVRGKVDGSPATLLLTATREVDLSQGIPAPSPVAYEVFRLVRNAGEAGSSADVFKLVQASRPAGRFCNAGVALLRQFGIPLPAGHQGPRTADGC
jgi:hypothetical protein